MCFVTLESTRMASVVNVDKAKQTPHIIILERETGHRVDCSDWCSVPVPAVPAAAVRYLRTARLYKRLLWRCSRAG